jgi:hypothetical protein
MRYSCGMQRSSWFRFFAVATVVAILCTSSFAVIPVSPLVLARIGKLIWDTLTFRHPATPLPRPDVKLNADQNVDIPGLSSATAIQKCENWAWAAGLETILRTQQVDLKQKFWVLKADGGEVCKDNTIDLDSLAHYISGDYVLDDGRHVRLDATTISGLPQGIDPFILAPQAGRPLMLVWKGHPYLYVGMTYDELRFSTGQREFSVTKLKFLDPFGAGPEKQVVYFDREKDSLADISGMMDVIATPVEGTDWLHPERELDHPREIFFPK